MPAPHHLICLQAGCSSWCPTNSVKALKAVIVKWILVQGKKVKAFPYSIPSVRPVADPGVQAVSPQVTVSHSPGSRLPLLSARPAVTSPAAERHRRLPVPSYTAWWQRHIDVNNLSKVVRQRCQEYQIGFEPATYWSQVQRSTHCTTTPLVVNEYFVVVVVGGGGGAAAAVLVVLVRPHRSTTYVDAAYSYWPSSVVCRSVCRSVFCLSH